MLLMPALMSRVAIMSGGSGRAGDAEMGSASAQARARCDRRRDSSTAAVRHRATRRRRPGARAAGALCDGAAGAPRRAATATLAARERARHRMRCACPLRRRGGRPRRSVSEHRLRKRATRAARRGLRQGAPKRAAHLGGIHGCRCAAGCSALCCVERGDAKYKLAEGAPKQRGKRLAPRRRHHSATREHLRCGRRFTRSWRCLGRRLQQSCHRPGTHSARTAAPRWSPARWWACT